MNNAILKSGFVGGHETTDGDILLINQQTTKELTADDVYTFKVRLCDNAVDRDNERFDTDALKTLADMFVGKTVISDHNWKSDNQCARVYKTEVIEQDGETLYGEKHAELIGYAYTLKSMSELIELIEGGIKKEVSVGCAILDVICSVCGKNNRIEMCEHRSGREYDGLKCWRTLKNPEDAYEISFVAVPAQPKAGVTKSYGGTEPEETAETDKTPKEDFTGAIKLVESFIFTKKERGKTN
jgi:hypothetical protein